MYIHDIFILIFAYIDARAQQYCVIHIPSVVSD